jgi:hypothetical protein
MIYLNGRFGSSASSCHWKPFSNHCNVNPCAVECSQGNKAPNLRCGRGLRYCRQQTHHQVSRHLTATKSSKQSLSLHKTSFKSCSRTVCVCDDLVAVECRLSRHLAARAGIHLRWSYFSTLILSLLIIFLRPSRCIFKFVAAWVRLPLVTFNACTISNLFNSSIAS